MKYKTNSETKQDHYLSTDMINLLVKQIQHEMYNHNLYKTFANFFYIEGLVDLGKYYDERAHEELNHHNWIVSYLNERDEEFKYPVIPEVTEEFHDYVTPFKQTLDKEIETTELIYKIVDLAQQEHDWMTFNWLMNPEKLVTEQIEEESISRIALNLANSEDSWISKANAILTTYNKRSSPF